IVRVDKRLVERPVRAGSRVRLDSDVRRYRYPPCGRASGRDDQRHGARAGAPVRRRLQAAGPAYPVGPHLPASGGRGVAWHSHRGVHSLLSCRQVARPAATGQRVLLVLATTAVLTSAAPAANKAALHAAAVAPVVMTSSTSSTRRSGA